jgi:putative Holliday junction resolvase
MDDTIGPRAKLVKDFAQRLADHSNRSIILVDERRTSVAADSKMSQTGLTHKQKKKRRDAIAAAAIAELYLSDPEATIDTLNPS